MMPVSSGPPRAPEEERDGREEDPAEASRKRRARCGSPQGRKDHGEADAREEAAREEAAREEAVGQEAAREEAAGQEAAREEAAGQEAAGQEVLISAHLISIPRL